MCEWKILSTKSSQKNWYPSVFQELQGPVSLLPHFNTSASIFPRFLIVWGGGDPLVSTRLSKTGSLHQLIFRAHTLLGGAAVCWASDTLPPLSPLSAHNRPIQFVLSCGLRRGTDQRILQFVRSLKKCKILLVHERLAVRNVTRKFVIVH